MTEERNNRSRSLFDIWRIYVIHRLIYVIILYTKLGAVTVVILCLARGEVKIVILYDT